MAYARELAQSPVEETRRDNRPVRLVHTQVCAGQALPDTSVPAVSLLDIPDSHRRAAAVLLPLQVAQTRFAEVLVAGLGGSYLHSWQHSDMPTTQAFWGSLSSRRMGWRSAVRLIPATGAQKLLGADKFN